MESALKFMCKHIKDIFVCEPAKYVEASLTKKAHAIEPYLSCGGIKICFIELASRVFNRAHQAPSHGSRRE